MACKSFFSFLTTCAGVVALLTTHFQLAHAQSSYEIKADGAPYSIRLGANQRSLGKLTVYFRSLGNISSAVTVEVKGPAGVKVSARGGFAGSADPVTVLQTADRTQAYKMRDSNTSERDFYTLTSQYPQAGEVTGLTWFHLQKDACSGDTKSVYVAEVTLDLMGVDPAMWNSGFPLTLAVKEFPYRGEKASSIKPSSDGMYRGEPIILMSSIQYGSEYFVINRWKSGRLVNSRKLAVAKYAGWRGYSLALGRLKGLLTGGKATFELSNGGDIYGACFTLQRRRQTAHGYPR
jgi:hypothetical protein